MQRFLRLPANAQDMKTVTYLQCNHFKDAASLTERQRRSFDVISHERNSYFTSAHEIRVPVGPGDKSLLPFPAPIRLCVKSASRLSVVSKTGHANLDDQRICRQVEAGLSSQECPQPLAMTQAPSQEYGHDADGDRAALLADRLRAVRADRDRAHELKAFFADYRTAVAAKTLLQGMPEGLRVWLTSE